ncbi:MAG TPA: NAD-dependent epimerase/dehydratase family protein [Conexivisphaerales archaeon]|nr:NAD-dependent epimerase/dehydratase family protein [Conexivisphaerales archaeon]
MKALVTGGAGFIGSTLCQTLLELGHRVVAFDDLSTGEISNIAALMESPGFELVRGDCRRYEEVVPAARDVDIVYHLAARAEVRPEKASPREMFEENVSATQVLLEAARTGRARKVIFASSSTVYGEAVVIPTPEDYAPLNPVSVYGATKLASEAIISAYVGTYGFDAAILRLANIVGPRCSHGVVHDFVEKLMRDPSSLRILGDGRQRKSYLRVDDCARAFVVAGESCNGLQVFNVGSEDQAEVTDIALAVADAMNVQPRLEYGVGAEGGRGWKGDVRTMLLDVGRIRKLGWSPSCGSLDAVRWMARGLIESQGALDH